MADVRRTLSALQTLLADNTAGDISAQDGRDVLVSAHPENVSQSAARASIPGTGQLVGDRYLPTDGYAEYRWDGSLWVPWGPLYPLTEPISGDFAWINQGAATVSTTNGGEYLYGPKGSGHNWRIRKKSAPATPYTITVGFLPALLQVTSQRAGPLFRQSSDGKFVVFQVFKTAAGGTTLSVEKWDSPTAFSASYTNIGFGALDGSIVWLRIADNGTNRICSYSRDGRNFIPFHTVGRTDFLTADEVGFAVDDESNLYDVAMTLLSWKQA